MAGQIEFMEMIRELEQIGESNGNQLSMEEITNYFVDMDLDEKQFDFICKYFEGHKIRILNRVDKQEEISEEELEFKEDPLDAEMVSIYRKETENLTKVSPQQTNIIAKRILAGDENARNLLIEASLPFAADIASEYKNRGLDLSDLIQESNIGLMIAVNEYEPAYHEEFLPYAARIIRAQITAALKEYNQSTRSAMKIASRVNELNDLATAFAKEYEREAKPQELAERMGITEEEVRELMKVSLDAIAILDENKIGR